MPPKKDSGASKKTVEKAKQKVVEDKTFGLKNKKGKKQQTYIKNVAKQTQGDQKKSGGKDQESNKMSKKELEKKKLEELNDLFKPVQQMQKVAFGVDPKSVVCMYFKQGTCQRGNKCKFSHDLSLERKSEKRSLYADGADENKDDMNNWDQDTLESVVNKKHGASNDVKTTIICKYFLEAVDKNQYGWFWNCPSSDKCIYRHALPPGYVIKKDKKAEEDAKEKISLEELIENERKALTGDLTPVTYESFTKWKKRKIAEKKANYEKEMKDKKDDFKSGKGAIKVSGKEVFMFKPELANADDDEADDTVYKREEDPDEADVRVQDINLEEFASSVKKNSVDDSKLTKAKTLSAKDRDTACTPTSTSLPPTTADVDANGLSAATAAQPPTVIDGVPVDESLFEDLDDLDIDD